MGLNSSVAPNFMIVITILLVVILSFYGCENEKDEPQPQNNPPVASIYASQKEGEAPLDSRIKVDGTDKDGKSDIANYSLEIKELGVDVNKKEPIDTTITFTEAGEYTIKGAVKDKEGDSDSENMVLTFSKDSIPENNIPVASISASPLEGTAPLESIIKVNGTDSDGIEDIKKYYLTVEGLVIDVMKSSSIDTSLVFSNPGEYNIRGIVEDSAGARDTSNVLVNVEEKPQVSVSQDVSLKDYVNLSYGISFENTDAVQLDLFKDGERILSKEINESGYNESFSYNSNDKITKGFYEFVANFKTNEGKDTSVVSNVSVPNYNPEVDWSNLNIDFDENSSKTVTLPTPTDKNPEDNPVSYIPESFSSNKAELEFNSGDRTLEIKCMEDVCGEYTVSAEAGDDEGGIISVSKSGKIYELLRLSGVVENNETHNGVKATVVPYEIIGNDTIRLTSNEADSEGRNITDASGYFDFKLNKRLNEMDEILLMARQGTPGDYNGWVRVQNIPKEEFKDVLIRAVPYEPYKDRKNEFKRFVKETTPYSNPFPYLGVRFDFDGSILGGLPEFEDYKGLEKIRILDSDPFTGGTFTKEEQEEFKRKLLDKENINGIIGDYEIKENQIVFGNDTTLKDYEWIESFEPPKINPSQGAVIIVPRKNLPYAGLTNSFLDTPPIQSRGVIYLKARNNNDPRNPGYNEATFSHEMGHLFISANHPESLYGESIMAKSWNTAVNTPGPADKKLGKIVYENSYLVESENGLYKKPDYLKNILRDDFK